MNLGIAQILLEEATFKHNGDFLSKPANEPIVNNDVQVSVEVGRGTTEADGKPAAVVRLRVSTKDDSQGPYHFSITYLIILQINGDDIPHDLARQLVATGALMGYPFVREVVANITSRGRFGPTWLAPLNYEALAQEAVGADASPRAPA